MMPALAKGGQRFLLSARNRDTSAELARRFGAEVIGDNAEIVRRSVLVILAVRPYDAVGVATGLPWRSDMTVLSLCAGIGAEELGPVLTPARLVMAMPVVAAEFGESPTVLVPDDAQCRKLLEPCGPVIAFDDERLFAPATVLACYYGWVHELISTMTEWTAAQGVPKASARLLVAQMTRAAATAVRERRTNAIADLVAELATPRSFTLAGLDDLQRGRAFELWRHAAEQLAKRLVSDDF